ncbi:methyltransferase type 11 [Kitasatospora herbaricolor]|uniref:class I SAM-dependent methyltransferase n=1 Tax=Kitasatospora herbaricolor TaxID=68217 RepID=UPI00174B4DE0|nr:class I SAM-dependent methyltransferase [Kitasatospora herbaricolor]MDQ0313007.1 SAM-dependent methyltransferase [Kitasatospora herbaricolor]GGV24817.1 methyltransferase type 11 [Kitasatospora herbaricolor]
MPTLPPPEASPPQDQPHHHRPLAESFGTDAERYDRTRPRYPDALVRRIIAACPGRDAPDLLDVGVGTGIEARQFRAHGCTVLGVEPDPRMAAFARRGGDQVEVATFEAWDSAGRRFDGVVSGQAWHWVDPAVGAAKAAGVLRPGGRLAAFWNVARPPAEAAGAFAAVYDRFAPESLAARAHRRPAHAPDGYSTLFDRAADGIRRAGAFGEPEQWRFDWTRPYTRDEWLDQLPTQGDHGRLPPADLAAVLAGVGAAVDALGGAFTMEYTAVVVTAALRGHV